MQSREQPWENAETELCIAVLDDDADYLAMLAHAIRDAGARPITFSSTSAFRGSNGAFDGVITDLRVPHEADGEGVVRECRARRPVLPVAVLSSVDRADRAIRLLRLGADDYLVKPPSLPALCVQVRAFVDRVAFAQRAARLAGTVSAPGIASAILAASPALKPLLSALPRAARSGATVLVTGESGTGKELAARAVHELSRRASGPMIGVDCGAIPEALIENELFGHRRGAFSDAREDRPGLVDEAEGGTLFLDEIGELPLALQVKLLRFLQTREFRRLGDTTVRRADVRVIAATHRDLRAAVRAGSFRQDLFFRLDVVRLELPPLRERRADIPLLANAFLRRYVAEFDSQALAFTEDALDLLMKHPWEGNVRELENVVQRIAALAERVVVGAEEVRPFLFCAVTPEPTDARNVGGGSFHDAKRRAIESFERAFVQDLLRAHDGRLSSAARAAGIDRKSLTRLLERHGLRIAKLIDR